MRGAARETAAAFGDWGDRDYQADFGATVAAPKLAASAKVGPVLPSAAKPAAPKPTGGLSGLANAFTAATKSVAYNAQQLSAKPAAAVKVTAAVKAPALKAPAVAAPAAVAKAATTAAATAIKAAAAPKPLVPAGMSAPTAAQKAASATMLSAANLAAAAAAPKVIRATATPAPKPTTSAAKPGNATTAQTGNFLDGGGAPLALPNVKDPRTDAQKAADAKALAAIAAAKVKADAQKTASANAQYMRERQAADLRAVERSNAAPTHTAGLDWNQIAAGGAVIAAGAAAIATGGALAGALAVPSVAGVTGAAVAADRLIAAAEKAKLAPAGATAVVGKAKAVLDTTLKLADQGVPDAVAGAKAIAEAAKRRVLNGALPGVAQALTPAGAKALDGYLQGASPAVINALASAGPIGGGYSTALTTAAQPVAMRPVVTIVWFVSSAGKVSRGPIAKGAGWRIYSDGKVIKQ